MKELPSEEEEIPFRIKTYKKKELACMYNPNITPRCAIRIFTKWIKINSRPLKSTHLRDIARKQCPADFFNK